LVGPLRRTSGLEDDWKMENGENDAAAAAALDHQQQDQLNEVEGVEEATTGVDDLQTPTKSTHSSAADDETHLQTFDNNESK